MRITSKGQVTIPARIREQAGLMPNTEVEFAYDGAGNVRLFRASKKGKGKTRGEKLVEHLKKQGQRNPIKMTTDEIMALTRGED
jgi:AbrB family looped-hinge helix DNA binding protein